MTDLKFTTKKAAVSTAKVFADRNKEGYCVLPLLGYRGAKMMVTSYKIVSFSEWLKECESMRAPITVAEFVRY